MFMHLSEVRISLCGNGGGRLKAFCCLTFDNTFVIRDVKLIDGNDGLFLAMPSRKLADHCPRCREKNHLRARFCNQCGARLNENRSQSAGGEGRGSAPVPLNASVRYGVNAGHRTKLYADIAHPINAAARHELESQVVAAYWQEIERSKLPGYVPMVLEGEELDFYEESRSPVLPLHLAGASH
jgi:stage V sporulation protein G